MTARQKHLKLRIRLIPKVGLLAVLCVAISIPTPALSSPSITPGSDSLVVHLRNAEPSGWSTTGPGRIETLYLGQCFSGPCGIPVLSATPEGEGFVARTAEIALASGYVMRAYLRLDHLGIGTHPFQLRSPEGGVLVDSEWHPDLGIRFSDAAGEGPVTWSPWIDAPCEWWCRVDLRVLPDRAYGIRLDAGPEKMLRASGAIGSVSFSVSPRFKPVLVDSITVATGPNFADEAFGPVPSPGWEKVETVSGLHIRRRADLGHRTTGGSLEIGRPTRTDIGVGFIGFPVGGLGARYMLQTGFRYNSSLPCSGDRLAIFAGVSGSSGVGSTIWALEAERAPVPESAFGCTWRLAFRDLEGERRPVSGGPVLDPSAFHRIEANVDASAGTVSVFVDKQPLATLRDVDFTGTDRIVLGDIYDEASPGFRSGHWDDTFGIAI